MGVVMKKNPTMEAFAGNEEIQKQWLKTRIHEVDFTHSSPSSEEFSEQRQRQRFLNAHVTRGNCATF